MPNILDGTLRMNAFSLSFLPVHLGHWTFIVIMLLDTAEKSNMDDWEL